MSLELVNVSFQSIMAHSRWMRSSYNRDDVISFKWRRHIVFHKSWGSSVLTTRRLSLSAGVVNLSLSLHSVFNILSQIATQNHALNLILQVSALVGGVTLISMVSAELGHIALSAMHGCVVCPWEGNCPLVGKEDPFPRFVELGMDLIERNVLLSFLAPIFLGVFVLPFSPVIALLWP